MHEKVVASLPFCNLVRFSKESAAPQPKMLLVAPLSGHFATLLRETVRTLVRDHEVYITDWKNARDVPLRKVPSASTIMLTTSFAALSLSGRGRMCSQSVSPAYRRSPLSPSWRAAQPGRAAQHDADGGPRRCAGQSLEG